MDAVVRDQVDDVQVVAGLVVPRLWAGPRARYLFAKRTLDLIIAVLLLVCLAPVFLICAVLVCADSSGPIIFRQQRIGQGGRPFTMLKFRSMYANVDAALHRQYVAAFIQGAVEADSTSGPVVYKLTRDPRITRVGHLLRRSSLDELPQLWNVLRGEMSLVGPRPAVGYEIEQYQPVHLRRLSARPGITGLWQVRGRSRTTFEEMVVLDCEYIARQSLVLDLQILVETIPAVLSRKGAA